MIPAPEVAKLPTGEVSPNVAKESAGRMATESQAPNPKAGGGRAAPAAAAKAKPPAAKHSEVVEYPAAEPRVAAPAAPKTRHKLVAVSFLLAVLLPTALITGYLYTLAADQYASRVAFSIRGNEQTGPVSFLGALSQTITVGGTDAEIVYAFVRSQQMVEAAAAVLQLETIYNVPERDLVFRLGENQPIEDLVRYWNRMNSVSFDGTTGIVNFEARAFDPRSAQAIAGFVLDESTRIVNEMSLQAREDAVSVAREVLHQAEDRLRNVRLEIRAFRDLEQELDPTENARAALGLMATLRQQLADAQIELDSYLALVGPQGPRTSALRQRIESLESRIAEERRRLGTGAEGDRNDATRLFADLMSEYEELTVELEFAENAYTSALASFEQAQVEARRQIRFLSPHIRPTLSVEAQYPQRALLALAAFVILTVTWAVLVLIAYNVRDRR